MGRYGRLGHGDETDQNAPRLVGELLNTHIAGVALGERHTAAFSGTHPYRTKRHKIAKK